MVPFYRPGELTTDSFTFTMLLPQHDSLMGHPFVSHLLSGQKGIDVDIDVERNYQLLLSYSPARILCDTTVPFERLPTYFRMDSLLLGAEA